MYVCLSVCLHTCLWNRVFEFHLNVCACYLLPWLGPPLTTLRYVMYFRFCEWRHICPGLAKQSLPQSTDFRSVNAFKRSISNINFSHFFVLSCTFVFIRMCFVLTLCTNYFSFNTTYTLVLKMRSSVLSDCFYFILFSLVSLFFCILGSC